MNYFVLFYRVVIDGKTFTGKTMKATRDSIFLESDVIPSITAKYSQLFPTAAIKVSILKARQTTSKAFEDFSRAENQKTILRTVF